MTNGIATADAEHKLTHYLVDAFNGTGYAQVLEEQTYLDGVDGTTSDFTYDKFYMKGFKASLECGINVQMTKTAVSFQSDDLTIKSAN